MSTHTDRLAGVSDGLGRKAPARFATTGPITLSGLKAVDGSSVTREGDRVVVWKQADATENGIYNASSGPWTRALDFDGPRDVVNGTAVIVAEGATYADIEFVVQVTGLVIFGLSPIAFMAGRTVSSDGLTAAIAAAVPAIVAPLLAPYVKRSKTTVYLEEYASFSGADTALARTAETAGWQAAINRLAALGGGVLDVPGDFSVVNAGGIVFPGNVSITLACKGSRVSQVGFRGTGHGLDFSPTLRFQPSHIEGGLSVIALDPNPTGYLVRYQNPDAYPTVPSGPVFEGLDQYVIGSGSCQAMIYLKNTAKASLYSPNWQGTPETTTQPGGIVLDGASTNVTLYSPRGEFVDIGVILSAGSFSEGLRVKDASLIFCNWGVYGYNGNAAPYFSFDGHCETFTGGIALNNRGQCQIKCLLYKRFDSTQNWTGVLLSGSDLAQISGHIYGQRGTSAGGAASGIVAGNCNPLSTAGGLFIYEADVGIDLVNTTTVADLKSTIYRNVVTPLRGVASPLPATIKTDGAIIY